MRRWVRYAVVLAFLAGLCGCGGSSSQGQKPNPMPVNRFPNSKELEKHLEKNKGPGRPAPGRNP
jgi:hypothetical protein